MALFDISEGSKVFQNAMLSTKLAKALRKLEHDNQIYDFERNVFGRGVILLTSILEGSFLVDGRQPHDGIAPSQEELSTYSHALSAIEKIAIAQQQTIDFPELFNALRNNMSSLARGEHIEEDQIEMLRSFFIFLSGTLKETMSDSFLDEPSNNTFSVH